MQSLTYTILWFISAAELSFGGELYSFFEANLTSSDFGNNAHIAVVIFFIFSIVTILAHQGFIYHSLHDMEDNQQKWKADFPKWYGSKMERILRCTAFIVLLIGVGKVSLVETFCKRYEHGSFHPKQILIIAGSVSLFLLLTIWNVMAWWYTKNNKFLPSDLFALIFWLTIAIPYFHQDGHYGNVAFVPLMIMMVYYILISARIYNYIKTFHSKYKSE